MAAATAAAAAEVKLLGLPESPFAMRARIALNLKGIGYEFKKEVLWSKSELLLELNPIYKKVPVLVHDGKSLCESMIIVQYIDEVWAGRGPKILSSDHRDRAIARFWAFYIDDKWFPSLYAIFRGKTEEIRAAAADQVIAGLQQLEEVFGELSNGKSFFGGDTIGFIDIALGCFLGWTGAAEKFVGVKLLDEAKVPNLAGWAQRFCSDDAVKEVMLDADRILEFGAKLMAFWNAQTTN